MLEIVKGIQDRAFAKMWRLEGHDEAEACTRNKSSKSHAQEPTFLALGQRLTKYKKTVMQLKDTTQSLRDRPDDAQPPEASSKVAPQKSSLDPN